MSDFAEVGDRVWVARYDWMDVNVSVVGGERGLAVVDTFASAEVARGVLADLRRLSAAPVLHVVNTHQHFDHTFGNGVFAAEDAEVVAHESVAETLPAHAAEVRASAAADAAEDPRYGGIAATDPESILPARTFSSAVVLDLGDRTVEVVHPGRGHTAGDAVLRVPDADVVLAGDLIEESAARQAVPGYGDDCYPMDWPLTLDLVLNLIGPDTTVVPGHGAPVGRDFVTDQRADIGIVAETIRDLAGRGVSVEDALTEGAWPWPAAELAVCVRRGYAQLPSSQRRLPLL